MHLGSDPHQNHACSLLDTVSSTFPDVPFIRLQVSAIFVSVSVKAGNAQFKVSFARLSLNHFM